MKKLPLLCFSLATFFLLSCSAGASAKTSTFSSEATYIGEQISRSKNIINGFPLSVACVGGSIDLNTTQAFVDGNLDSLNMKAGDWVVFALKGAHLLQKATVSFVDSFPQEIVVTNTDINGVQPYDIFSTVSVKNGVFSLRTEKIECAFLKIEILEEQEGVYQFSGLEIDGDALFPDYIDQEMNIIMEANDPKNPLNCWRIPIEKWIYTLADDMLKISPKATPHEKIIIFMDYIAQMNVGVTEKSLATMVKNRIGACGSYTNLLLALAVTQNIAGHVVSLANFPENNGHSVAALYIGDRWCIYDPTYASYYTTTPENPKTPYVLSIEELLSGRGSDEDVLCISSIQEKLDSGEVSPSFLGPDIYEQASPAGIIGTDKPMVYPLYWHWPELQKLDRTDFNASFQGISYMGAAGINATHHWEIDGLRAGEIYEFSITAAAINGEKKEPLFNAYCISENAKIILGETFAFSENDDKMVWNIQFIPTTSTANITLTHNELGPMFHYIPLQSIELKLANA